MNFPQKLKDQKNWIIHFNKKPKVADRCNKMASTTDPSTWRSYEEAVEAWKRNRCIGAGLGFVFSSEDDFVGIDLDHCVKDGLIEKWAEQIIYKLNSYTEYSYSGSGFHIILEAKRFGSGKKNNKGLEIYFSNSFFAMTGNCFDKVSKNIENREKELDDLINEYNLRKPPIQKIKATNRPVLTDAQILAKASKAKNGKKFMSLWNGDYSNYKSSSEADLALCKILAFWSNGNFEQVDRLFRQSKLMNEFWDSNRGCETYGIQTTKKILG